MLAFSRPYFWSRILRAGAFRLLTCCLLVFGSQAQGQEKTTRILFMLDCSQSMSASWGKMSKMEAAKKTLSEIVDSLRKLEHVQMALRAYGHQVHYNLNNCKDTRLEVGFRSNNHILIQSKLGGLKPKGITPIAYSLERAERDFPDDREARNIIIIITDGEESCEGDPCATSLALQRKNIILKPFVIGLGRSNDMKNKLDCVGAYYEAANAPQLNSVLKSIIRKVLDETTVQVNLLDEAGHPTETNVNMTFYNSISKVSQYNYYHTLNVRGNPDTIDIDPINKYDLIVHTIPPVGMEDLVIKSNQHNIIQLTAPQGFLKLIVQSSQPRYNQNIRSVVRKHGYPETIHLQAVNSTEKYLTGVYDIEILTLPRIKLEKIRIDQSKTTTVQIPEPGLATFHSSVKIIGSIFLSENDRVEKIYSLSNRQLKESVLLQPGNYTIIYRNKLNKSAISTMQKSFRVVSGESITINL